MTGVFLLFSWCLKSSQSIPRISPETSPHRCRSLGHRGWEKMQMCSEDLRTKERSEMEAEVPKGYDEGGEGDWNVAPAGSGLWSVRRGLVIGGVGGFLMSLWGDGTMHKHWDCMFVIKLFYLFLHKLRVTLRYVKCKIARSKYWSTCCLWES